MREAELNYPNWLDHPDPWTEAEYLALDETGNRIELIDGGLWVSPQPVSGHQDLSSLLDALLRPVARAAKLRSSQAINVRLGVDRIVVPDITVADRARTVTTAEAREVVLVAEITSPSNAAVDRIFKRKLYAEARIEWYLLVEPNHPTYDAVALQLLRLRGKHYVEHAAAEHGETLTSELPFPIEISTEALLDF